MLVKVAELSGDKGIRTGEEEPENRKHQPVLLLLLARTHEPEARIPAKNAGIAKQTFLGASVVQPRSCPVQHPESATFQGKVYPSPPRRSDYRLPPSRQHERAEECPAGRNPIGLECCVWGDWLDSWQALASERSRNAEGNQYQQEAAELHRRFKVQVVRPT